MFSRHSVILVTISSLTQLVYESVLKVLVNNSFFFLHFVIKVYSHQRNVILSYFYILQFVETFFVTNILLILKNILRFLRMGIWKEFIFSSLILLYLVYFISSIKYSLLICCFLSDTFLLNLICYNPGEVNYLLSPVLFCLFFYYLYYLLYECLCYNCRSIVWLSFYSFFWQWASGLFPFLLLKKCLCEYWVCMSRVCNG